MAPWCVLIHQIPPRPLYLRAKVRQQLAKIGAIPLKNSVYVLPLSDEAVEDFSWVAQEIEAGGGQAFLLSGEFVAGADDANLIEAFNKERAADYAAMRDEIRSVREATPQAATRLRQRFDEVARIDFFQAPEAKEVQRMLQNIEKRSRGAQKKQSAVRSPSGAPSGATWVTRRGIKIDRIASAWLVRRFIDPAARFRFVDPEKWRKREGEIAFDMIGGDYTHEGNRCTFESIVAAFALKDAALRQISEIVHDIDLKDEKFGRADAAGIRQLLEGILASHSRDEDRLERGMALFDDLHRSFGARRG